MLSRRSSSLPNASTPAVLSCHLRGGFPLGARWNCRAALNATHDESTGPVDKRRQNRHGRASHPLLGHLLTIFPRGHGKERPRRDAGAGFDLKIWYPVRLNGYPQNRLSLLSQLFWQFASVDGGLRNLISVATGNRTNRIRSAGTRLSSTMTSWICWTSVSRPGRCRPRVGD